MGKETVEVLEFKHNKNVDDIDLETKGDSVRLPGGESAQYSAECMVMMKNISTTPILSSFINRHRKRRPVLLHLEGKPFCERLETGKVIEPITDKDRELLVKKEIAKHLGKFEQIKPWMFIVLLMIGILCLILLIIIASGAKLGPALWLFKPWMNLGLSR